MRTTQRRTRCLTKARLRGVPRPMLEQLLGTVEAALGSIEKLIDAGADMPRYRNERAVLQHNAQLLRRHLSKLAA